MSYLLIDGDMLAYRCAASCEPSKKKALELGIPFEELEREPIEFAVSRLTELIYRIYSDCGTDEGRIFLSGPRNFRKDLCPAYKANRDKLIKPLYLEDMREILVREWGSTVTDGYEADDGIGIAHSEHSIVVSNDKDFKQLVGVHYNPVKSVMEVVDSETAPLNFYSQMLIGDDTDNIKGVKRIGPVNAKRLLSGLSEGEMYSKVNELYGDTERFLLNHRLLRILRSIEEYEEIEATIRESQRAQLAEAGSSGDTTVLPGANQE